MSKYFEITENEKKIDNIILEERQKEKGTKSKIMMELLRPCKTCCAEYWSALLCTHSLGQYFLLILSVLTWAQMYK